MRLSRVLALGAAMLVAVAACSSGGGGKPEVKVGSDGFYESKLVAEMFAPVLEADGYKVARNLGIGAREVLELDRDVLRHMAHPGAVPESLEEAAPSAQGAGVVLKGG